MIFDRFDIIPNPSADFEAMKRSEMKRIAIILKVDLLLSKKDCVLRRTISSGTRGRMLVIVTD
jgi:hypothetical protein